MKILQVGRFYPLPIGGVEQVIRNIYEGLNATNIDCDILSYSRSFQSSVEQTSIGTIYRSASLGCFRSTWLTPLLPWHLKRLASKYNVIHLHHPDPMSALAFFLVRPSAKLVLHWHCNIVRQKIGRWLLAPLIHWLLKRADAIIVTTPSYKRTHYLKDWCDKVRVIPTGIDSNSLHADAEQIQAIRASYPNRFIVLAVGRLIYYKGFEYLIKAASLVDDQVVVLIGGAGKDKNKLERLINTMRLQEKVKLLGYLGEMDLARYYQACDLFCMSSVANSEAFGIVQLEAMKFGKAIVSTIIPESGVNWVNADQISGINVKAKDSDALARAISVIQHQPALRERLGKRGQQRFHEMFSREQMCKSLIQLYESI